MAERADQQPSFVALRELRVTCLDADGKPLRGEDGRPKIRTVAIGEPVPEADYWKNCPMWISSGHIGTPADLKAARARESAGHWAERRREKAAAKAAADQAAAEAAASAAATPRSRRPSRGKAPQPEAEADPEASA